MPLHFCASPCQAYLCYALAMLFLASLCPRHVLLHYAMPLPNTAMLCPAMPLPCYAVPFLALPLPCKAYLCLCVAVRRPAMLCPCCALSRQADLCNAFALRRRSLRFGAWPCPRCALAVQSLSTPLRCPARVSFPRFASETANNLLLFLASHSIRYTFARHNQEEIPLLKLCLRSSSASLFIPMRLIAIATLI